MNHDLSFIVSIIPGPEWIHVLPNKALSCVAWFYHTPGLHAMFITDINLGSKFVSRKTYSWFRELGAAKMISAQEGQIDLADLHICPHAVSLCCSFSWYLAH